MMFAGSSLGLLDVLVLCVSLAITVLIGLYFANKNKTFADYARGGGNQNLWAVSASMAVNYSSALTLIGCASELYLHGSSYALLQATQIFTWPIASFVLLPVFKQIDAVSVFQYIELRYSSWLRRFVALLFIFTMTIYTASSLYLPSLPLKTALEIPQSISISLVGTICILYSTFGGLKAVTCTNVYHAILLVSTMVLIIIVGVVQFDGSLSELIVTAYEGGRFSLGEKFFSLDLTTRHTIWNTTFGMAITRLFLHGASQMQVQSALSLSTTRKSQLSQLISAILYFLIQVIALSIGLIIYVSYRSCDPFSNNDINRQEEILAHYISKNLSSIPAMQGIFIAAVFGSTLTSMSSYTSSTSTMLVEDFLRPAYEFARGEPLSNTTAASLGKLMALVSGLACVLLTFQMDKVTGLQQAVTILQGAIGVPILAAFLLGILTRFTNSSGVFVGISAAIAFGLRIVTYQLFHMKPVEPSLPVSVSECFVNNLNSNSSAQNLLRSDCEAPLNLDCAPFSFGDEVQIGELDQVSTSSIVLQMSYLWLPTFTFAITIFFSIVCSLLTGGASQQLDDKFLAPFMHNRNEKKSNGKAASRIGGRLAHSGFCQHKCKHCLAGEVQNGVATIVLRPDLFDKV